MPHDVKDKPASLQRIRARHASRALSRTADAKLSPAAEAQLSLEPPRMEEVEADTTRGEVIDRLMHAWQARLTYSISPAALMLAFMDWGMHLANAPGKQATLVEKALRKWVRLALHSSRSIANRDCPPCIEPLPQDRRFSDPAWQQIPYKYIYQAFLLQQQWWHNATTNIRGVSPRHEDIVA